MQAVNDVVFKGFFPHQNKIHSYISVKKNQEIDIQKC